MTAPAAVEETALFGAAHLNARRGDLLSSHSPRRTRRR